MRVVRCRQRPPEGAIIEGWCSSDTYGPLGKLFRARVINTTGGEYPNLTIRILKVYKAGKQWGFGEGQLTTWGFYVSWTPTWWLRWEDGTSVSLQNLQEGTRG